MNLPEQRAELLVWPAPTAALRESRPQALRIAGMRIKFGIDKSLGRDPNTAEITVSNLRDNSRSQLQAKGAKVVLLAGYDDNLSQIFAGTIKHADQSTQVGWDSRVQCGDGERAMRWGRISTSIKGSVDALELVKRIAGALEIDPGNASTVLAGGARRFESGYAADGNAAAELDRVLGAAGMEWSIQDGRLQVLTRGATTADIAVLLEPDTGLVGSPEVGTNDKRGGRSFVKVRSVLNPLLKPGAKIDLRSKAHRGILRAEKVRHSGDTGGNEWYSDVEATQIT